MKGHFVADLQPGLTLTEFFLLSVKAVKQAKHGPYVAMTLSDKTGDLMARVWNTGSIDADEGDIVKIAGPITEYQGNLQLNVEKIRRASVEEYELTDMLKASRFNAEEMVADLLELIATECHDTNIRGLLIDIIQEHRQKFMLCPAAKVMHHSFLSGLLEHVLSMSRVAVAVSRVYNLNASLMLAGTVLHDIGKIFELEFKPAIKYTDEGQLLGHIALGLELVSHFIKTRHPDFPLKVKTEVMHLIVSHHGLLEYGSPRVPLFKEALALHLIDMLDSKFGAIDVAIASKADDGPWTEYVKAIGGPAYVSK